jgi:serine/threonine protein kinase
MASIIGEGSYGCVHKPELECNNNSKKHGKKYGNKHGNSRNIRDTKKKKYISKFMLKKNAIKEFEEYKIISKIDKNEKYYLGKPLKCRPKISRYNIKSAKKCDIYKEHKSKSYTKNSKSFNKTKKNIFSKYSLLILPDGGEDISKLMNSIEKDSVSKKNEILKKFWDKSSRLFEGIIFFKKHGILHHDVKPQNILFDLKTENIKFIDFGLMRNIDDVKNASHKNKNYIAEYPFWTYPFEFTYLNKEKFMKIAELSLKEKKEYFQENIKKNLKDSSSKLSISCRILFDYILRNHNQKKREEIINKYLIDFMNFIIYEMHPEKYDEFLKKSLDTIDLFGLGITLQFVLCYSEDYFDNEKWKKLEDLFFNMMRPSLIHRYSAEEALKKFNEIMDNKNDKDSNFSYENMVLDLPIAKKLDKKTLTKLVAEQEELLEKKK